MGVQTLHFLYSTAVRQLEEAVLLTSHNTGRFLCVLSAAWMRAKMWARKETYSVICPFETQEEVALV